jgi:uncharacterized repeat protein (TIGR03803 family)
MPPAWAQTESVIYSFQGGSDGGAPAGNLLYAGGKLYGTAARGGNSAGSVCSGCGTVFSVTPNGVFSVVHRFSGADGCLPGLGVQELAGILYGTTPACGSAANGTVFSLTSNGKETTLHAFAGALASDGAAPASALTVVDGSLYATTMQGGKKDCYANAKTGCGTAYSVSATGAYKVIHIFVGGGGSAPMYPTGTLAAIGNTMYGTTEAGGSKGDGAVFKLNTSGELKGFYSFSGVGGDAGEPIGGLVNVGGTLYGTSESGGSYQKGAVFSVTPGGKAAVLYSFTGGADGGYPTAGLTYRNGILYGTTLYGGSTACATDGCGTVFGVTLAGVQTVLHSFAGGPTDGDMPSSGLTDVNGVFYGVTTCGGTGWKAVPQLCGGVVYAVKP